jgi:UDP-N-acetylmuramoylalanine--D-glutamate ligase
LNYETLRTQNLELKTQNSLSMDLRGKRALVMGLGIHGGGLGVARFLADHGAHVTVTDLRGSEQLQSSLDALADLPITFVLGQHRDEDFRNADLVIRNPGVPRESRYLQIARANGAVIEMEMTLFFRLCPGPILGITGTKGKTTTTLLTAAMLREQYPDTVVAGNLRVSALETLPRITAGTPVVLELSSWQLEGLGEAKLSPKYACVTNISPDHLDRYGSMEAYADAKQQILAHQQPGDVVVLNYDDPLQYEWAANAPGDIIWFARRQAEYDLHDRPLMIYGETGVLWLDASVPPDRPIMIERVIANEDIGLPGPHNRANVGAAAALAKSFGISNEHIRNAIHNFTGIEHRLEFVREFNGVRYVNDTAATAPDAAIAALRSFDRPIVLIAGGADKNLPFDDLAREIVLRAKAVVLLNGTATAHLQRELRMKNEELKSQLSEAQFSILNSQFSIVHDNFAEAIEAARALAAPGDMVLLSPGCASFGMFRNEFHRGEEFRRIVRELAIGD